MKLYAMMMGRLEGNPGPEILDNWFEIGKSKDGYKFVFCPSACSSCKVRCKELGIVLSVNGVECLTVSNDPLSIMFYKQYNWCCCAINTLISSYKQL